MPFCDVMELLDYWADYPPVHWMIRSYLGIEKRKVLDPMEAAEAMKVLNRSSRGRSLKLSRAPDHVKKMAEAAKKKAI